jgi:glyoxylase-like metal-dependent hydrolase (beta-lactamase superfamily II)
MNYQPAHYATLPAPEEHAHFPVAPPKETAVVQISESGYWINAFSNAGWFVTSEGVVLIDSGANSRAVTEELRRTTDLPIRYVVYTHGHADHTFTAERFAQVADAGTKVIGHAFLPERLSKYEVLHDHIVRTNQLQFHRPMGRPGVRPPSKYPDIVYHGEYEFTLGGRRFHLFHARGETDDATIVHVEDEGVVFAGDFLISSWPNLGNPFKVPRYARGWYEALERIQGLKPRVVAPGHGIHLLRDPQAIDACLGDTIATLRYLHDEVVRRLNEGQTLAQMQAEIRLPRHLEDSPYLEQSYSRMEMAVAEIHRGYTGWFDWDPSDLYAVPRPAVARVLRRLIDDDDAIVGAARELWQSGARDQAVEVLQVLLRDGEGHVEGRRLRLQFMETLLADDKCLMSRGVWHYYAGLDRAFLGA